MAPQPVRSVPPWVDTRGPPPGLGLPSPPPPSASPSDQHNHNTHAPATVPVEVDPPRPGMIRRRSRDGYEQWVDPQDLRKFKRPPFLRKKQDRPGRKWDHLRSSEPFIMGSGYRAPNEDPYQKWRDFIASTRRYNGCAELPTHRITQADLEAQMPGLDGPPASRQKTSSSRSEKPARKPLSYRLKKIVLRSPLLPPAVRLIALATSLGSLAFATQLLHDTTAMHGQAITSLVIDSIAIPYVLYMVWDEFTGVPLGLRSAVEKAALTLLDLVFIIVKSISMALAIQTKGDSIAVAAADCKHYDAYLGLITAVAAWLITYIMMVFRLVEQLHGID